MKRTGIFSRLLGYLASHRVLFTTIFIAGILTTISGNAVAVELKAVWDNYTDPTATHLKLWHSGQTTPWILIDGNIATADTLRTFSVDLAPGESVRVRIQAVNRNLPVDDPNAFSALVISDPWTMGEPPAGGPPATPTGIRIVE